MDMAKTQTYRIPSEDNLNKNVLCGITRLRVLEHESDPCTNVIHTHLCEARRVRDAAPWVVDDNEF
jgi:hypothetical protein